MQVMLEGMPDSRDLRVVEVDGQVLVLVGQRVIARWDAGDAAMRNLAAVTLRNLGFTGQRVAQVLGLSEEYVATLRGRARRDGSAGVVPRRGRPPALGARELRRARRLREQGLSDVEISRRLGVHATTVGRALGPRPGDRTPGTSAAPRYDQTFMCLAFHRSRPSIASACVAALAISIRGKVVRRRPVGPAVLPGAGGGTEPLAFRRFEGWTRGGSPACFA